MKKAEGNRVLLKKDNFYKILKERGMSVTGLSRVMGVNTSTIYRMLNQEGETSSAVIARMMDAFGMSEQDFGKLFIFSTSLLKSNSDEKVTA